jgi:hypothetical protein
VSIGYELESGPGMNGTHPNQRCEYSFNGELADLDGSQAVQNAIVEFYVADDPPTDLFAQEDFPAVDFERIETAEYFRSWDRAGHRSESNLNAERGYGLEESECISFQFFASLDNLYVYSSLFFVVPYEGHDTDMALAADTAAYRMLEALVAPVVAELEQG